MRTTVVLLLCLVGFTSNVQAQSILILDVNQGRAAGPAILDTVRKDVQLAGYQIRSPQDAQAAMVRELQTTQVASQRFAEATRAYEKFDINRALKELGNFDAAWKEDPIQVPIELLSRRHLLQGLLHFAQKDLVSALRSFRLSSNLHPSRVDLSAGDYRPAVVTLYARARVENQNAKLVSLSAQWTPTSAQLWIDGKPAKIAKVREGPHIIELRAPGHRRFQTVQDLAEGSQLVGHAKSLSTIDGLLELREELRSRRPMDKEILEQLCALASVSVLVLLEQNKEGQVAAVYRKSDNTLTPLAALGSLQWQAALSRQEAQEASLPLDVEVENTQHKSWYRTWWGGGLLATGSGALIGTALYLFLSSSNSSSDKATIDQWCFGECP